MTCLFFIFKRRCGWRNSAVVNGWLWWNPVNVRGELPLFWEAEVGGASPVHHLAWQGLGSPWRALTRSPWPDVLAARSLSASFSSFGAASVQPHRPPIP